MVPVPVFSSLMPFFVHNPTVFFPWISACYFDLVSSSALPARSQMDHTQFARQLQYDFPIWFLTALQDISTD